MAITVEVTPPSQTSITVGSGNTISVDLVDSTTRVLEVTTSTPTSVTYRSLIEGGTGVTYSATDGVIHIGQDVATSAMPSFYGLNITTFGGGIDFTSSLSTRSGKITFQDNKSNAFEFYSKDSTNNLIEYQTFDSTDGAEKVKFHKDVEIEGTATADEFIGGTATADEFIGDLRGAIRFQAKAGERLEKGEVVYISDVSGQKPVVSKARADSATTMPAFGLANATVNNNANLEVISFGTFAHGNTTGGAENWEIGDVLYVSSTTAGALTNLKPSGESNLIQNVGKVERVHASSGSIMVAGAGRTAATPNLDEGKFFIGDSNNYSSIGSFNNQFINTSGTISLSNNIAISGELQGGSLDINGNADISGNTTLGGDLSLVQDKKIILGGESGDQFEIYENGLGNGILRTTGDSDLLLLGAGGTKIFAGVVGEEIIRAEPTRAILWWKGTSPGVRLLTKETGVKISGELEATSLDINGNADISGNLTGVDTLTASGQIQGGSINVYNTDTDANSDPQLDLYRNSSSPASGDSLGIINFYGENDQSTKTQYAAITGKIANAGESGESGKISFTVASEGNWNNDALAVAQDGVTINGVGGQDQKLRANVPITTTSSITAPTYTFPGLPTNETLSIGSSVDNDAVKMRFRIGDPNDNGFGGGTTATRDGWIWEGNYSNFGGYQTLMSLTVDNQPATLSVQGNITASGDIGALSFTTSGDNNFISTGEMNVGNSDGTINVRGALANNAPQLSIKTVGADTRIQEHNSGNIDFPSTTLSVSTAPTAGSHVTNKTYVDAQVSGLVGSAPETLNTLNELAAALGDNVNFSTETANSLGNRLRIDVNDQSLTTTQKSNASANLGLGTAATTASSDYATAAQGTKADSALQTVAFSDLTSTPNTIAGYGITDALQIGTTSTTALAGNTSLFDGAYNSLSGKPTLGTAAATDSSAYATAAQGTKADSALQSFTEANDLSAAVTWANVPDANITSSSVVQHQGDITGAGALNSGSITSGFGTIDNGSSNITTTGAISAGTLNTGDVLIKASAGDNGANATPTPILELYQEDGPWADDGDHLGEIQFTALNNNNYNPIKHKYAGIHAEIIDEINGTEDGSLHFTCVKAGVEDNTVLTLNGSGSTLFSDLIAPLKITSTTTDPDLIITNTKDSADASPILKLLRKASSTGHADGEDLGKIEFYGNNDRGLTSGGPEEVLFASMSTEVVDSSDGTEDGQIKFTAIKAGSATDVLTLNGSGSTIYGNLEVKSTTADGNFLPEIRLKRDGGASAGDDGDVLGALVFEGDNFDGTQKDYARIGVSIKDDGTGVTDGRVKGEIRFACADGTASPTLEQPSCSIDSTGVHINSDTNDGTTNSNYYHVDNVNLAGVQSGGLKFNSRTEDNAANKTTQILSKDITEDHEITVPNVTGTLVVASIAGGSINGGGGIFNPKSTWSESDFNSNPNSTYLHYNPLNTTDLTVSPSYPSSGFGDSYKFLNASPQSSEIVIDLDGYSGSSVASYALVKTDGSLNATINTSSHSTITVSSGGFVTLTKVDFAVYLVEGIGYTYS